MASRPQRRKPENRNPERIEPVAKEADPGSVLEGLGDDDHSELATRVDQRHAAGSSETVVEIARRASAIPGEPAPRRLGMAASVVI